MGSSSSKFRKHLQHGDEYAAVQLFNSSSDLRKGLDPNSSYGDTYSHDTPMHYAARHAMKSLLRIFLYELGGNPNKKNARNETSLHCLCMTQNATMYSQQQRRLDCLSLLLQWRGATLQEGELEKLDLGAVDEKQNTGLHYASQSGLKRCVELLVSKNAPLFVENNEKLTPCDLAEKNQHNNIALYLESRMVFSQNEDENTEETENMLDQIEADEAYSGLRAQDLQEAKDQLLVETSDMLRVPLFTAEALLRNHEWSREALLEGWMQDPVACCEKSGVQPPPSLRREHSGGTASSPVSDQDPLVSIGATSYISLSPYDQFETTCDICTCLIPSTEHPVPMTCEHTFCRECWQRYLTGKIQEGDAHNITCPGFNCMKLVPVEIIETLVSKDVARRYLQFDIKAFVESNPNIKWCPYPECNRAVKLPDSDNPLSPTFRDPMGINPHDFSRAVDCGSGHLFCWECLGEAHEPASCDAWTKWHQKIGEIKPEELSGMDEETELAANCLWLVTNSKNCPNCKSPIQKNEGCNHMKCSKCKHDFCWVCLEAWKKHSSATGGYFRCNRYEVVRKVEESTDKLKTDAEHRNLRMQELNKFLHYYTRFKNHENSYSLELPLLDTAKEKMMVLSRVVIDTDPSASETKFVEDAVNQLLKARRVLKCSYVYGYYLGETGYKKPIFEFMQTELEECTEALSEMVARPYLRTPRYKIIQTTHLVQRKRHEFLMAISKGLVPADTSPATKKKREKYSVELDEDLKKALLASLQELAPGNTWVKDPSGRHTNLAAVLDWPDDSEDSDAETPEYPRGVATCIRRECDRPRAQNPRTGEFHDHCSIKCMRSDQLDRNEEVSNLPADYFNEYELELLRALEMSRLQFLREMGQLRPGNGDSSHSPRTPARSPGRSPGGWSPAGRSPRGVSPGGGTSPNPDPIEDVQLAPLILQDPPKGRAHRPRSSSGGGASEHKRSKGGEFDRDLQRAIELSRLTYQDEERDLRMAIELSLKDSGCASESGEGGPSSSSGGDSDSQVTHSKEYSTIVTRVPNKSVEDLQREVNSEMPLQSEPGACGGSNQSGLNRSHDPESLHVPNTFGLIKDISVANILANDKDKTKEFEKKDFSQMYTKGQEEEGERCEQYGEVKKQFLTPSGIGRKPGDIWLEQSTVPSGRGSPFHCPASNTPREPYTPLCSTSRHYIQSETNPYCTLGIASRSPKEKCPLASPFSRSPRQDTCPLACGAAGRGPRDRRSYSGFESYTDYPAGTGGTGVGGRSTPDLLQIGVANTNKRSTSWGDAREAASMTQSMTSMPSSRPPRSPQPSSSSYPRRFHVTMDDNDPGPRLDAVLRSLHKLTARLGDEDSHMFPSYHDDQSASTSRHGSHGNHGSHGSSSSSGKPEKSKGGGKNGDGKETRKSSSNKDDHEEDDDAVFV